jgi:ABC-2 type transport system ATP-binding protein
VSGQDWVIEAIGITKRYDDVVVLDGVDLRVGPAEIHGLVGPNGAGKTTLLATLFGLVLPEEGTVRLFGRTRIDAGSSWLDGVGGFVETPTFYPYLSGRRNLEVLANLDGAGDPPELNDLLDLVDLGSAGAERVRGYSLGMRQRLGLAAALLRRPRLLILDEPTNGMDPAGVRDLRSALTRVSSLGVSVVLSSHDMAQIEELCRSVTVLSRGKVVFSGPIDQMRRVAPRPSWRLTTSDHLETARQAAQVAGVELVADGQTLVILATQPALDDLVIRLGQAQIAVRSLTAEASSLEAMFLALTGDRTAREGNLGEEM